MEATTYTQDQLATLAEMNTDLDEALLSDARIDAAYELDRQRGLTE